MGKDKITFNVGDMVFAKVRGYPAWPARISSVADPRPGTLKYNVYFFGTAETYVFCLSKEARLEIFLTQYLRHVWARFLCQSICCESPFKKFKCPCAFNRFQLNQMPEKRDFECTKYLKRVCIALQAAVLAKDICSYAENKEKLGKPVKRKFFKEGLEEIEREIKKIKNGEESTLGLWTSGEPPEAIVKRNIRKSKKGEETSDLRDEDSQNVKPKPGKRKRDGEECENETELSAKKKRTSLKDKGQDASETPGKLEQISRSGRVIKPKKFLYDEENEDSESRVKQKSSLSLSPPSIISSPPNSVSQEPKKDNGMKKPPPKDVSKSPVKSNATSRNRDMGRIMWAKTKCGQMVQIKLDYDRPAQFKDDRSRLMWERATDINAKRLKAEIESGDITREDIKLQMKPTEEEKAQMTEEQLNKMKKLRIIERKRGKLRWLKLETRLVDIDVLLKTCLQKAKVDIDKALSLMDELINMPLDPLMLKKHPQIVDTTKKLRQYVGNLAEWNLTSEEKTNFEAKAYKIRQKANILFNKYTALFAVPENTNFWNVFLDSVNEFAKLTEDMPRERVYGLIVDPTSPYFKDVCQDEKEEEEFKLKLKEAKDESESDAKLSESEEKCSEMKSDDNEEK